MADKPRRRPAAVAVARTPQAFPERPDERYTVLGFRPRAERLRDRANPPPGRADEGARPVGGRPPRVAAADPHLPWTQARRRASRCSPRRMLLRPRSPALPSPTSAAHRSARPPMARTSPSSRARWSARSIRRPNPKAEPFVKVGDRVDANTVVCIIEAMKVFNEIPAEVRGQDRRRARRKTAKRSSSTSRCSRSIPASSASLAR